jgi:hypothetical protein
MGKQRPCGGVVQKQHLRHARRDYSRVVALYLPETWHGPIRDSGRITGYSSSIELSKSYRLSASNPISFQAGAVAVCFGSQQGPGDMI